MEICMKCRQTLPANVLDNGVCILCVATKQDTIEKLQARIAELELELQKQKAAAERGEKLIRVMWGDNFNIDSLH